MIFDTIVGLNRLKNFFPDNFDIIGECLHNDVSIVRLFHLKSETSGESDREKLYALVREVTQKKIRGLIEQITGVVTGYYHKKSDTIALNADLDRVKVANEFNRHLGIDIDPDQIYIWIFFHELGHKRGLDELGADSFANQKYLQWRSEIY